MEGNQIYIVPIYIANTDASESVYDIPSTPLAYRERVYVKQIERQA